MFEKKLDKKDLREMTKIRELINQYAFMLDSLKNQEQMYFKSVALKYKMDLINFDYSINLDKNRIEKVEKKLKQPIR